MPAPARMIWARPSVEGKTEFSRPVSAREQRDKFAKRHKVETVIKIGCDYHARDLNKFAFSERGQPEKSREGKREQKG